eukprot:gene36879-biopygen32729
MSKLVIAYLDGNAFEAYLIYRDRFSAKAKKTRARLERLSELPVHRALLGGDTVYNNDFTELVRANLATVNEKDEDGDTALKIILSHKCRGVIPMEAMVLLLEESLPFDTITGELLPVDANRP